ncbi:hypothetical protein RclHR1_17610009 [Rhizophagus clarus]|nr:hypothetical protein RclHR1_17610009 [Rhizophagus clarus]
MKLYRDNKCTKARTENGSARLIQKAYQNYRKRPVSLAKQVWEAVRNDNTPREKKFLSMPSRNTRCTVNLDIWYSIDGLYRPSNIPLDQFYDYISYSKYKRRQLSDRLAIARNKIQCNYTAPSKYTKPRNITSIKPVEIKDFTPSLISKFWNESRSLIPPSEIFISSIYAKQNNLNHLNQSKDTMLRLGDGTKVTIV